MMRLCYLLTALVVTVTSVSGEEARLLRYPDVHHDRIAFVYAGDLYTAPREGGTAVKLTDHVGLELFPKFSPDGSKVAFTGQYDGDMAVYVMPLTGGEPQKLTYHPGIQKTSDRFGPENIVLGWHRDGDRVLFRSRKETNDWWDGRVYWAALDGGLPEPLPMNPAGFTSISPDGQKAAYCPIYRDFRTWKRYKGGMAQDVWLFDLTTFENEKITDWEGTDNMPMWFGEKVYFNSDRTGTLNIFCYDLNTRETRQVTTFTEFDVRWPSLGPDGIAFENGGYVYVMDLPSEELHKPAIQITTDLGAIRPEYVSVSDKVRGYDLSPDAKRAVFSARGELFTLPAKEGNTRNLTNSSGANDRDPSWSPDGKWVAYLSDATGEDELYLVSHDGSETVRLTTDGHYRKYGPVWSPDSRKLAFSDKELNLFCVDIDSRKVTRFDSADRNEVHRFSWSPDSRYVAYAKTLESRIRAIFVYDFRDSRVRQITPGHTNDWDPAFGPDGKYLFFLSQRDFNPILSSYEFEFANRSITNLFLIVLAADGESPFAPESDEVKVADADDSDDGDDDDDDKGEDDSSKEEAKPTRIDFEGIFNRQVAINLPAGSYGGLEATSGALFYVSHPIYGLRGKVTQKERALHKYDIEKEKDHVFADGIRSCRLNADGKKILIHKGSDFYISETSGKEADLTEGKLDLSHMEMNLNRRAEMNQMFEETWRIERDFFYDENMHGVDWQAIHDRYAQLLPHVAHRYDLVYVIGEMIGELCCSHTYVGGGDRPKIEGSKIGLLGVDFEIDRANDRVRIGRILRGENWDANLRSPLLEPGIDVNVGDYLLAIDGQEVTASTNPYELTANKADQTITLTIHDKPNMAGAREVTVTPITSEEALRYFNWVEDRRLYVDSVSEGQVGYLHMPDMDSYGLFRFTKMFYHQLRKPGLILDVRYNGGGFVSGLMLERLRRTVAAMGMSRTFAPGPSPGAGLTAHMITLTNEFSCSDGDYFPYFFREYGLGPLMGKRTWGGVIGIRGYRHLVDGGYCTAPEFGIYGLNGEWIMENIGVEPDIEVDNPPDRTARGFDDQLDRALEYIMDKLQSEPRPLPPVPGPPEPR